MNSISDFDLNKNLIRDKDLEERNQLLTSLINSSEDFICYIDKDKHVKLVNNKLKSIFQNNSDLFLNKSIDEIINVTNNQEAKYFLSKLIENFDNILNENKIYRSEMKIRDKKGLFKYFDVIKSPIYNSENQSIGMLIVGRDITETVNIRNEKDAFFKELRKLNDELYHNNSLLEVNIYQKENIIKELENTKKYLSEMNKEKDRLFSIIAHDLKSPFNGLLGLSKLLADEIINLPKEEVRFLINKLKETSINLYKLLDNLLEWSKLQLNKTNFNTEFCDIKLLINTEIEVLSYQIQSKNLTVYNEVPDNIKIKVDGNYFRVIICNLLSNAVKFTPKHKNIYILYQNLEDYYQFSVIDEGIGIPDNILENLFTFDETIKRKGTDGEPSSGLGLILCKEYVIRHNGKLTVKTAENEGSNFTFTISKNL